MDIKHMHEVSYTDHQIFNPITHEQLMLLGEICRLRQGQRQLDIGCGKGEMLCQWAAAWGIAGLGVDVSELYLSAARARAEALGVVGQVGFRCGRAQDMAFEAGHYDIVSAIGCTSLYDGPGKLIEMMRPAMRPGGIMLYGEPYWNQLPPDQHPYASGFSPLGKQYTTLVGTVERFEAAGMRVVEMTLADKSAMDRYFAGQWWSVNEWLDANGTDDRAQEMREFTQRTQKSYLAYERDCFGFGVFVLRSM